MNIFIIEGKVPVNNQSEVRVSQKGTKVSTMSIVKSFKKQDGTFSNTYYNVSGFGDIAEQMSVIPPGSVVCAKGRIQPRKQDINGQSVSTYSLVCDALFVTLQNENDNNQDYQPRKEEPSNEGEFSDDIPF